MPKSQTATLSHADLEALDRADPLASFRGEFALPDGVVYLDGNSLGPLPINAASRIAAVVEGEWGQGLIRSWNDAGWIGLAAKLGDKIGQLLGAPPGAVLVADSTSVNLFKLLSVALRLRPGRRVILSEQGNFPTDMYIAEGLIRHLDRDYALQRAEPADLPAALTPDVAVVMLTHVNYRTGAMHDMAALTAAAHDAGALILWDLAHSAGAVPIDLLAAGVDLAVGCGYKFLNGGPGAPAFLYVAKQLQAAAEYPLTGWLGHAAPFAFEPQYRPADGIARAMVGTPSIIAMAALEAGIDIARSAPMAALRRKSLDQSRLLMDLVAQHCGAGVFQLATPVAAAERGSQVSFRHPQAYPIMQALIARGVIGDFRAPDILRFGITPLYLRYADLWDAAATLGDIMASESWRETRFNIRQQVT